MNDNENKSRRHRETESRAPLAKRAAKLSAFVYLGLAVTVVIAATIGIFSISYDDSPVKVSLPDMDFGASGVHAESRVPDLPVGDEQSGVEADTSEPDDSSAAERTFYCPVSGKVGKGYSVTALVFSQTMKDYRVHTGIDISAPAGTPVIAYAAGEVVSVENDYFYGTTVAVKHDYDTVSYYMSLSPELAGGISVGAHIAAGQQIGSVGNTARVESADGPHLHFELRVGGETVDPSEAIPD